MGKALDRALSKVKGDNPRSPAVLRAQLRRIAEAEHAAGGDSASFYVLAAADTYEVATAFPSGAGIDDQYDWMGEVTFKMLLSAVGSLSIYGDLVNVLGERFIADAALGVGGCFDQLAKSVETSLPADDCKIYETLNKDESAVEFSSLLRRVLPIPDEVAVLHETRVSARVGLRKYLQKAIAGEPIVVDASNVNDVISHFEAAKLVVGPNAGGVVAINMLTELLRISLNTTVPSITLGFLTTGMEGLVDLLPTLRSDRLQTLPPSDRLIFVAAEVGNWRQSERTSSRGGGGSAPSAGASEGEAALVGYPAAYQVQLRRMLADDLHVAAVAAIEDAIREKNFGEAIKIVFCSGELPLVHAISGQRHSIPGHPIFDTIATTLRPLGPQAVADTLADAIVPKLGGGLVRRRPAPQAEAWRLLCKGAFSEIPYEDLCFAIQSEMNGRAAPPSLPMHARFTLTERIRVCEPGIIALLELRGKISGRDGSLDTLLKKVYRFDASAQAVAQTDRSAIISQSITGVLQEAAVAEATWLSSSDPTSRPALEIVQPGSGGEAILTSAMEELPQNAAMVSALLKAVSPHAAKFMGLNAPIQVPGIPSATNANYADVAAKPLSASPAPTAPPQAPSAPPPPPPSAEPVPPPAPTKKKKGGEDGEGDGEARVPSVGALHARLCEETETHYGIGNKKSRQWIAKDEMHALCPEAVVGDESKFCPFYILSTGKHPAACCGKAGKPGHESHTSSAHRNNLPKGARKKILAVLLALAASGETARVAPAGVVPSPDHSGVPSIAASTFDFVGGIIFAPVRLAARYVPEIGLPRGSRDAWFGEANVTQQKGRREAALATAWNWSSTLFGETSTVVPFGLFEDVAGADGQVIGAVAPPRTREGEAPAAPDPTTPLPTNVDIFAGAGGLALGLRTAGFTTLALVENDARCVATLERNGLGSLAVQADVADADYSAWADNVTLLSGGPPCQPFSVGGLQKGAADERDGWTAALHATEQLRPRAVLFENVRGLLAPRFAEYRNHLSSSLGAIGYHHAWFALNAADYGVPQHRHRVFLVGFRDAAALKAFALPASVARWTTVREALRELGPPQASGDHAVHGNAREYVGHTASELDMPSKTLIGGGRGLGGGSGTVKLDTGEVRYFTVREAARLQTFPAAWRFDPVWTHAVKELGNAVPPLLAKALGEAILRALRSAHGQTEDHAGGQSGSGPVQWVKVAELTGTPLGRVARLVAARVESFLRPTTMLREPYARVGAAATTRIAAADLCQPPTPACTPLTAEQLWNRALTATTELQGALAAKIGELRAEGGEVATYQANELEGWMGAVKPPPIADITEAVLAQAALPTDPALANISLPAFTRPVTTTPMPLLPQPPPPAAIPGNATRWEHAFSKEATNATLRWMRQLHTACNSFLRGTSGDDLWPLLPRSMAFGIEHFQPWLAHLAAEGHVIVRRGGRFEVSDASCTPPTQLNRGYIQAMLDENGCTDAALRDALLTHGFVYFTDLQPQVVLQTPLRSLFRSVPKFVSLHQEVLRMSEKGWFEITAMPDLDNGHFELTSCPGHYYPVGGVDRALEERQRPIKDCRAPRKLLLTMAPPNPKLHSISGGGRVPVHSVNTASGIHESKKNLRDARERAAGGKPPPPPRRQAPGLRRDPEPYGERDTFVVGNAPPEAETPAATGVSAPGAASGRGGTKSWAGGKRIWPPELKPFFIDLMLAVCILGYGAALCGAFLYVATDDCKDMFHVFPLAVLQLWTQGSLRLDPRNLTAESVEAALAAVLAKCLEMGVSPSSNWTQRYLTEMNMGLSKRFARANEAILRKLDEAFPAFAAWRAGRRQLALRTGRDEAVGHWLTGYTDDVVALVIGTESMVLYLTMHAEHYGPRGLNMTMAIAAKRSLGVATKFIGGNVLTVGALAYVAPEKVQRTDLKLQMAIEGTLLLADWIKLIGLLNHLVCLLLLPYYIMYDVYEISDASRAAGVGLDEAIVTTPRGVKGLRRFLAHLRSSPGTSALAAAVALRRAPSEGVVHVLRSDAAILGTAWPALCGHLYGAFYILRLTPEWLLMPIVVLEFLGGLINIIIFGPRVRQQSVELILDALVVVLVVTGKAKARMMRFLHKRVEDQQNIRNVKTIYDN